MTVFSHFWARFYPFYDNASVFVKANASILKNIFASIYVQIVMSLGGQQVFFDINYFFHSIYLIFASKTPKRQNKSCHPPI